MQAEAQTGKTDISWLVRAALIQRGQLDPLEAALVVKEEPEHPEHTEHRIPTEDEKDWRWFFAEERTQEVGGGGSNFGVMLERAHLYHYTADPCTRCGGIPEVKLKDGTILVEAKGGTGLVLNSRAFMDWQRMAEKSLHRRRDQNEVAAWLLEHNPKKVERRRIDPLTGKEYFATETIGDISCPNCCRQSPKSNMPLGTPGWRLRRVNTNEDDAPPDVHPTGSSRQAAVQSPDVGGSDSLARLGRMGRMRAALRAVDALAEATLSRWYAPDGDTVACLWGLTPAGRKMLEGNTRGIDQEVYFKVLRSVQDTNKSPQVARLFAAADKQGAQLLRRLRRVYAEVFVA